MAYELKEGQGTLFLNDRKTTDNHPDLNGTIKIDGKIYYLSAWKKQGNKGEFFSISKGKEVQPKQPQSTGLDDEIKY